MLGLALYFLEVMTAVNKSAALEVAAAKAKASTIASANEVLKMHYKILLNTAASYYVTKSN